MISKIGKGTVLHANGKPNFIGELPFNNGEEVVVLKKKDLDLMINAEMNSIILNGKSMGEEFYTREDYHEKPFFEDQLVLSLIESGELTQNKLFLDRHFYYPPRIKDVVFVRYVGIDQSLNEETPL